MEHALYDLRHVIVIWYYVLTHMYVFLYVCVYVCILLYNACVCSYVCTVCI